MASESKALMEGQRDDSSPVAVGTSVAVSPELRDTNSGSTRRHGIALVLQSPAGNGSTVLSPSANPRTFSMRAPPPPPLAAPSVGSATRGVPAGGGAAWGDMRGVGYRGVPPPSPRHTPRHATPRSLLSRTTPRRYRWQAASPLEAQQRAYTGAGAIKPSLFVHVGEVARAIAESVVASCSDADKRVWVRAHRHQPRSIGRGASS